MSNLSSPAPAFCAGGFTRPVLQSASLFLVIAISVMATVKPAQAAGTIAATATYIIYHTSNHETCENTQAAYYAFPAPATTLASFQASFPRYCHQGGILKWTQVASNFVLTSDTSLTFTADVAQTAYTGGSHGTGIVKTWAASWTCPPGYTGPDASHMCTSTCPPHASGSPCACEAEYKFDAAGTSCVLEQYTISLQIPPPAIVAPGATKSAYAQVAKSDGSAKSGVQVDLSLTVVPELQGQLPSTYTGTLSANTVSIGTTAYGGKTGTDGRLNFAFKAPTGGGLHTITATCSSCTNSPVSGKIKVPGCSESDLTKVIDISNIWDTTDEQKQLTRQLEGGMNGYSLLSPATQTAEQCLARRINTVVGPPSRSGYKVTSTIRTPAYQKHLREVWNKFWVLKKKVKVNPTIQQRCQTLISEVEGQMGFHLNQDPTIETTPCNVSLGAHCIRYRPGKDDPKHVAKTAFDIPPITVRRFAVALWLNDLLDTTVQQEANTCGLTWGGTWRNPDRVHFLSNK